VFITVDMKAFDQTIHATGVGSEKLNYGFKKYLLKKSND